MKTRNHLFTDVPCAGHRALSTVQCERRNKQHTFVLKEEGPKVSQGSSCHKYLFLVFSYLFLFL